MLQAVHFKNFAFIILCTVHVFCISRKGGTEGGGWGHPQGAVYMAAARLGRGPWLVSTGWAISQPGCMNTGLETLLSLLKACRVLRL